MPTVLCVAEKPSLAASIAGFLSDGTHKTRRGGQDVHEFVRVYDGQRCDFKVTAGVRGTSSPSTSPTSTKTGTSTRARSSTRPW